MSAVGDNQEATKRYHLSMAAAHLLQSLPDVALPEAMDRLIEIWKLHQPARESQVRVQNPEKMRYGQ